MESRLGEGYDVGIIGAGVVGLMVGRALASRGFKVLILDRNPHPGMGVTSGQAGVIHVVQLPFSSLKSKLALKGNQMYDSINSELGVQFRRVKGLLVVKGVLRLPILVVGYLYLRFNIGSSFRVELARGTRLRMMEPELSADVSGGIVVHGYGVIDVEQLVSRLSDLLRSRGVKLALSTEVIGAHVEGGRVHLQTSAGEFLCGCVVNAAGLYSDEMARRLGQELGSHVLGLGAMAEFSELQVNNLITPLSLNPSSRTKGGAIIPTTRGTVLFGPGLRDVAAREGWAATNEDLEALRSKFVPLLRKEGKLERLFAGLRPQSPTGDFLVELDSRMRVVHLVGIESPGLTAAPALAELVFEKLWSAGLLMSKVGAS